MPVHGGALPVGHGPNDANMHEPDNAASDYLQEGIHYVLGKFGYSGERRGTQGTGDDNDFYRRNADWMPGWGNTFGLPFMDPNGVPSGATAQDRATNYVGHSDPDGIWAGVRANLMTNESAKWAAASARGEDHMGYWDLYDAHVHAYADAQTAGNARRPAGAPQAGNPFIDPASFALAVYGAPLLEHAGIDTGPLTGASIDLFNDPTQTVGDGWGRRMALAGAEIGGGAALGLHGLATGDFTEMAGGAALAGVGAFSGAWNTVTAIQNGMGVREAASGLYNTGSEIVGAGASMASDAWHALGSLIP